MAKSNPFVRAWKYFGAWFGAKVDEKADPKIQIQQAIEEAQREHEALTRQAANVIGNQRQLEMKLALLGPLGACRQKVATIDATHEKRAIPMTGHPNHLRFRSELHQTG